MTEHRTPQGHPPTIAHLKSQGLTGARVFCTKCHRMREVTWQLFGLADKTPFPDIALHKRFVCSGCGSRAFTITPDWAGV
jgi:hypothetical protein